jgi:hypothetical protein
MRTARFVFGIAVLASVTSARAGTLKCPTDSVKVGNVCIDAYEASVWQIAPTSAKQVKPERTSDAPATRRPSWVEPDIAGARGVARGCAY